MGCCCWRTINNVIKRKNIFKFLLSKRSRSGPWQSVQVRNDCVNPCKRIFKRFFSDADEVDINYLIIRTNGFENTLTWKNLWIFNTCKVCLLLTCVRTTIILNAFRVITLICDNDRITTKVLTSFSQWIIVIKLETCKAIFHVETGKARWNTRLTSTRSSIKIIC